MHGVDDALGDVGKGDAGLLGGHRAGEDARADQEQALLAEQPQAVEKVLVGIGVLPASPPAAPTIRCWSGIAPKKRGSISPSMICGCRASMSPSRGAAPRISATSATRSRFWLQQRDQPPAALQAPRKRSNAVTASSGSSACARPSIRPGTNSMKALARRLDRAARDNRRSSIAARCRPPRPAS